MYLEVQLQIFVLALIANVALGWLVLWYAPKNISKIIFPIFALLQILWFGANYWVFSTKTDFQFLWSLRLVYFFSILHAASFFAFVITFLQPLNRLRKNLLIVLNPIALFVSSLSLSKFMMEGVTLEAGNQRVPILGWGVVVYTVFIILTIAGGFLWIVFQLHRQKGVMKKQWEFLTWGFLLTFFLILYFSFINPIFFTKIDSVKLGHIYTLPFVISTAYAMIRHKLLNIKVITAELAVIILNLLLILQFFNAPNNSQRLISFLILGGTITGGVWLVSGVHREVKQREQLQALSSELSTANEKLRALDQARADFITIASHQLRTPPATIKWYISSILAADFGEVSQEIKKQLERVMATNNGQISLIDDMLNASRIERGKMEFMFEEVDLEEVTRVCYEGLKPLAEIKHLELLYIPPKFPIPKVWADREKIRQVINNFIDNAIKYTREGWIKVKVTQVDGSVKVEVSDTGKGIDPALAPHLFEKYNRGKDSVTHAQGLGLGLYVCKIVMNKHHGKVWAESPGEGKGSSFIFEIPINKGHERNSSLDLTNVTLVR